jgi:type II secretory pathway pseudopilin PulG
MNIQRCAQFLQIGSQVFWKLNDNKATGQYRVERTPVEFESECSMASVRPLRRRGAFFPSSVFGFTMVELLMVLLILAEIATFTIPKVLQSAGMNNRYAEAQEVLATMTDLTYGYALQNGGCFPGNLTCNFNHTTGAAQDGLATTSSNGQTSYDAFEAYLDSHLNYVEKGISFGAASWTLPNGATYRLWSLRTRQFRPSVYELSATGEIFLDTTIAQVNAGQFSEIGVDTDWADLFTFAQGGAYGGLNNWSLGTGFAYDPGDASIFDLKDHPGDVCTNPSVGGSNCGL